MQVVEWLSQNWEVISLLITNILAYFAPSPTQRKIK